MSSGLEICFAFPLVLNCLCFFSFFSLSMNNWADHFLLSFSLVYSVVLFLFFCLAFFIMHFINFFDYSLYIYLVLSLRRPFFSQHTLPFCFRLSFITLSNRSMYLYIASFLYLVLYVSLLTPFQYRVKVWEDIQLKWKWLFIYLF